MRVSFSKEVPQSAHNYALRTLGVARLEAFTHPTMKLFPEFI
jgi:hypothetical protein